MGDLKGYHVLTFSVEQKFGNGFQIYTRKKYYGNENVYTFGDWVVREEKEFDFIVPLTQLKLDWVDIEQDYKPSLFDKIRNKLFRKKYEEKIKVRPENEGVYIVDYGNDWYQVVEFGISHCEKDYYHWVTELDTYVMPKRCAQIPQRIIEKSSFARMEKSELKLIENLETTSKEYYRLISFRDDIYRKSFVSDLRENFNDIIERLKNVDFDKQPKSFVVLAYSGTSVIAGAIYDYYKNCNALHLTYIAVNEECRNKGFGSNLYANSLKIVVERLKQLGFNPKSVFFEIEKYANKSLMAESPSTKLFKKFNGKRIPIKYIQPALSKDKQPVDLLLGVCKFDENVRPEECYFYESKNILDFLYELYHSLKADDLYESKVERWNKKLKYEGQDFTKLLDLI